MKLISENLHIISKSTKEAVLSRDEAFVRNLLKRQINAKPDWIDLNIGPAKGAFAGTMKWLVDIVQSMTDIPLSLDSTNADEIAVGMSLAKKPETWIINSTNADEARLDKVTDIVSQYGCNVIALTMNSELGIPKESDKRLELAFEISAAAEAKGISNDRLYFDPLILPVCVDQTQALEALNTIRMLKESFDPEVMTTIGLSNVSNGCPKELRAMINRVFMVMAMGCGLDSAIVDSFDEELLRVNNVIEKLEPEKNYDNAYINLFNMMQNFEELDSVEYDTADKEQVKIIKTAEILLNKKVYTNSYLEL
ncbi:MAG: dihydropteroate synthase [Clostridium sp.]|nr:dihydropteroate synthase [Clostridium sp.]